MTEQIQQLVEISQYFGKDKSFVIAGGGNTSYKDAEKIWIKASGISLATIDENGFVSLLREKLKGVSKKAYSIDPLQRENEVKADLHSAILEPKTLRPSVETSLHDAIDYRFIVHTHPTKVNGLLCSLNAKKSCHELFGDKILFIPYTDPGYILFIKVEKEIVAFKEKWGEVPKIIFLENHGVFVGADTIEEIRYQYDYIINTIEKHLINKLPSLTVTPIDKELLGVVLKSNKGYDGFESLGYQSDLISRFVKDSESFKKVNTSFSPDDIVYCKAHYLFIPSNENLNLFSQEITERIVFYYLTYGYLPKVIAIGGKGVVTIEENERSAINVWEVYENILKISYFSENFGGPQFLNEEQIAFIDNWEVENYRRKIAKS